MVSYLERMANKKAAWAATARSALERFATAGLPNFGPDHGRHAR